METLEISEADVDSAEDKALEDQTPADREAEELAALVDDVYLIGQTCKDYYADSLAFEKQTQTFKQYIEENRDVVLQLKAKFPKGFHNTRILIRGKQMTWEEFVNDCFGVSRQYIDKLLKQSTTVAVVKAEKSGPTEKELLKAKVVELQTKVEELNEELQAKAAPEPVEMPEAKIELPRFDTGEGILPDYAEPTFTDVVYYFESLHDAEEQVQQITELCLKLGIESFNL